MTRFSIIAAMAVLALPAGFVHAQVRIGTAPRAFAMQLEESDRPRLGISTRSSGKRDTLGLLVESVTPGSPAEKAGIEEGDRLVSVNGVNLRLSAVDAGEEDMEGIASRRLIRELEKHKAGDEIELRLYRDGQTRSVRAKLATAEDFAGESRALVRARASAADRAVLGLTLGGTGSKRDTMGVLVVGIADDGPAARAGIEEGDRVASINGVELRVAREDAGDWQATSARINRLHREMAKVKPGDEVELRVQSGGQLRAMRVKAVKASELPRESGAFFFGDAEAGAMMDRIRTIVPRAPRVAPVPPRPPAPPAAGAVYQRLPSAGALYQGSPYGAAIIRMESEQGAAEEARQRLTEVRLRLDRVQQELRVRRNRDLARPLSGRIVRL